MADGFAWAADNGAHIINCSFGYDKRGREILPDIVRYAIDHATTQGRNGKGCIIVWAAGNGDEDIELDEWASYDKVIAVAASTDRDVRAWYSDFGNSVHVCAPSSGDSNNRSITTTSIAGYTDYFGGTSAAAPVAAGIAALLLSINPNLTWKEVKQILANSAEKIDQARRKYGRNGHSDLYGYGRLNAFNALAAISILDELVRGQQDLQAKLPEIRKLVQELLAPNPSWQQIVQIFDKKKF
jgi:subtilisin family serine protease